jgi:hypothetical protein
VPFPPLHLKVLKFSSILPISQSTERHLIAYNWIRDWRDGKGTPGGSRRFNFTTLVALFDVIRLEFRIIDVT